MGEALVSSLLSGLSPPRLRDGPLRFVKIEPFMQAASPKRSAKLNNVVTKPNIE